MLNFISHRTIGLPQASFIYQTLRFATKKAGGSTRNGRDSCGKRLGLKKTGGERVSPGNIIVRQRGLTFRCGTEGVKLGRDYTIYSVVEGFVAFKWDPHRKKQVISVLPTNPYARKEPVVVSEISESCSPSL